MTIKELLSWCDRQIKLGHEVEAVKAIKARLKNIDKTAPTPAIYVSAVAEYKAFLSGRNIPLIMDGRQGKALKQIIAKLKGVSVDKSDDGALKSWKFILEHWNLVGDFTGRQIKLSDIDRNLLEILDKIRNGANKRQNRLNEIERLRIELTQQ